MKQVSSAELRELLVANLVILPEQGEFGEKQRSGRQNLNISFDYWPVRPASNGKHP